MRKISDETKAILKRDVYMKRCCLCGREPVEWHHNIEYQGRQSDNPKSIMPLCEAHHKMISDPLIREEVDWCMYVHKKLDPADFPKSDFARRRRYLINRYGA